ncbi:MAG: hypothetical protein K8S27_03085 [Candidatus Omnitrophica bacterium]|nr:hypothetical protein [Candidatus Omnitrophota bacterium]
MKKIKYFVLLVGLLTVFIDPSGKIEAADVNKGRVEQDVAAKIPSISIYDEDDLLNLTIGDAGKYHGDVCTCLTVAFKATKFAISQLWKDEIPRRGDFKIVSALPTPGSRDAFEFIARVVTRGNGEDFKVKMPGGTDARNMSKDNFAFTFVRKSSNEQITVYVKDNIFPKGYFELRKKVMFNIPTHPTQEEEKAFKQIKQKVRDLVLYSLSVNEIFDFEIKHNSK